jgi:hypothetical protein
VRYLIRSWLIFLLEVRRVHGFFVDDIEILSVSSLHLCCLCIGDGRRLELGVHDLESVTHHIVRFCQCAERSQNLVVDTLRQ